MDLIRSSPATSHRVRLSPAVLWRFEKLCVGKNTTVFSAELGEVNMCLTAYKLASV
jgi:hypothetical protein